MSQRPPAKRATKKAKSMHVGTSLPIVSSPPSSDPPQDIPATPIDPLLLTSSLASYLPVTFEKLSNLDTHEAEENPLMNAARNATLVTKICLDRGESVPAIPRPVQEVEVDVDDLKEKVDRLEKDSKKMKGKVDRMKAAKEEVAKKAKDAVELFKNGLDGRKFALEFIATNNADVLSHLLGDLFEMSEEGSFYKYRVQTHGEYMGKCDEQERIYETFRWRLGKPSAETLKAKLGFPESYDPIPLPHELIFPPDPDAERDDDEDDEEDGTQEDSHGGGNGGDATTVGGKGAEEVARGEE